MRYPHYWRVGCDLPAACVRCGPPIAQAKRRCYNGDVWRRQPGLADDAAALRRGGTLGYTHLRRFPTFAQAGIHSTA
jgi:hypothetical protein